MIVNECVYILDYDFNDVILKKHHSIVFSSLNEIKLYLEEKKLLSNKNYSNFNIKITFFEVFEDL